MMVEIMLFPTKESQRVYPTGRSFGDKGNISSKYLR